MYKSIFKKYKWHVLAGMVGATIILVIFYLIGIFDSSNLEGIKISLTFLAMFATFGGAYIGAEISGKNASEIAKKERIISSIMNNLSFNYHILSDFNSEIRTELEEILKTRKLEDIDSLIVFYWQLTRLNDNLKSIIERGKQKEVFSLILFDYENLKQNIDSLLKSARNEYSKTFDLVGKSIDIEDGYKIIEYDKQNYIRFEESDGRFVCVQGSSSEKEKHVDMKRLNLMYKKSDINTNNIFENIEYVIESLNGFTFNNRQDIDSFIVDYYKI